MDIELVKIMEALWVALVAGGFTVLVAIINRSDKTSQSEPASKTLIEKIKALAQKLSDEAAPTVG